MSTFRKIIAGAAALVAVATVTVWILATRERATMPFENLTGEDPKVVAPNNTLLPTMNVATAVGWRTAEKPVAAPGLAVHAFASGLEHPRGIYVLPNGDVLISESNSPPRDNKNGGGGVAGYVIKALMSRAGAMVPSPNRIVLLRDANGDGSAEIKTVLIEGLNSPQGMAWADGRLYIANTDALVGVPFTPGETRITAKPDIVARLPFGFSHWARNVLLAPDGKSIYVAVGSSSNIAERGMAPEAGRAAVHQIDLATGRDTIFAHGLRNPGQMAFEPGTGELFTVVNERDMLGSDLVPDYLTAVKSGGFYGWPWYYWGGVVDERVSPDPDNLRPRVIRPDYSLGPHVAALGIAFGGSAHLGPKYANGAFIAEHGSWNRRPFSGYKVVYVPFAHGKPKGEPSDLLTGFLSSAGEARGRPVALAVDKQGALLVTDDVGGRVWRVVAMAN